MTKDRFGQMFLLCSTLFWAAPSVALTDYDGDGRTDTAFIRRDRWSSVPVLFSNGDGSWRATNFALPSGASWANQPGVISSAERRVGEESRSRWSTRPERN